MDTAAYGSDTSTAGVHAAAVARTLTWAEESAARGDYEDALAWLGVLDVIGERLPHAYAEKRGAWRRALTEQHCVADSRV